MSLDAGHLTTPLHHHNKPPLKHIAFLKDKMLIKISKNVFNYEKMFCLNYFVINKFPDILHSGLSKGSCEIISR